LMAILQSRSQSSSLTVGLQVTDEKRWTAGRDYEKGVTFTCCVGSDTKCLSYFSIIFSSFLLILSLSRPSKG
jgi:hypothetical protein